MSTQINTMEPLELRKRLNHITIEAYKRRSRQLPSNISEIVDTFKADLLRYMPTVPIETVDEAVIFEVLHDDKTPFSPSFLFQAVRKHYTAPTAQRDMDKGDIFYWKDRLRFLEGRGLASSPMADECRWWINKIQTGDTEADTITLLDLVAYNISKGIKAYFDPLREYNYLRLREQIPVDAATDLLGKARDQINVERVKNHQRPIAEWTGVNLNKLNNRARHLAVVDWLRKCNAEGRKPSDILTPLMDEYSYQQLRKTV